MSAFRFGTSKYKAKPADGFASKLEKAVWIRLRDQEVLGLISDLKRQRVVILQDGPRDRRINWKIDFSCHNNETGLLEYHEAKGVETADYRIKLKLFKANPPAKLSIWKGSYKYPKIVEIIEAKK